jgi:DNA-binding transcriptional ArsR family regulator
LQIIRDPKIVQVVIEKSRWEIWKLLRDQGQLTAEEISEKVNKNVSTIYRHLKKLIEVGFVKEHDIQKNLQKKYVIKEYSAMMTDAFFILSEEAEKLIASQPGETSILSTSVPQLLDDLKLLGFKPKSLEEEKKSIELMRNLFIRLSSYLGDLMGDQIELQTAYTHRFEMMRRILMMILIQTDPEYARQVEELKNILMS